MKSQLLWLRMSLILLGVLLYAGTVWDPVWSTVDDGNDLTRTVALHQRLVASHVSLPEMAEDAWNVAHSGLYRPCNPWLRLMEYKLFGLDCWKHHAWRLLVMLGVCQVFFSIVLRLTGSAKAAGLTTLLYTIYGPNAEPWFPLNDPIFYPVVFSVLSLWCLALSLAARPEQRAQRWSLVAASVALYVPVYFAKETSLGLAGGAAAVLLACALNTGASLRRQNLPLAATNMAGHAALALAWFGLRKMFAVKSVAMGTYTSDYQVTVGVMVATAFKYADALWNGLQLLLPAAVAVFVWRVARWLRGRRSLDDCDGWAFVGLCSFGSVVALMLPWRHPVSRYLVPALPGLALFVGLMLWRFLSETRSATAATSRATSILRWVVIGNLVVFSCISLIRNYNFFVFRHDFDHAAFAMVDTLARHAPHGARLYVNMPSDYGIPFEDIRRWLVLLHGREDLQQFNYNNTGRPEPRQGDYLLTFVREPPGRSPEHSLDAVFHTATLGHLAGRLKLIHCARYDRMLLNAYPDAPVFNAVASAGIKLPYYLGMQTGHHRSLIAWERSLVEWCVYRFER